MFFYNFNTLIQLKYVELDDSNAVVCERIHVSLYSIYIFLMENKSTLNTVEEKEE